MSRSLDLDVVGVIEGTDKSSSVKSSWDYLRHYQRIFDRFREQPINIIEIGVASGSSLGVWKLLFSRARIIGVDISPSCKRFEGDRVTIEIGSQDDPEFLARLCADYPPTIIIDDGSHRSDHMIYTFERMFPSLLPGGLYVVEDIALHFGPGATKWRGLGEQLPQDYFLHIARSCMARSLQNADDWGSARYHFQNVDVIEFFKGAAVIRKCMPRRDVDGAMEFADEYRHGREPDADVNLRLSQFILKHGGSPDRAEAEIRAALGIAGETPTLLKCYAIVCERQGRLSEAVAMAERGAQTGQDGDLWFLSGNLRSRQGDHIGAVRAYQQASTLVPTHPFYALQLSYALERVGILPEALTAARQALTAGAGTQDEGQLRARVDEISKKVDARGLSVAREES